MLVVTGSVDGVVAFVALDFIENVGVTVDIIVGFTVNAVWSFVVGVFDWGDVLAVVFVAFVVDNIVSVGVDGVATLVVCALECVDGIVGVNVDGIDVSVENDDAVAVGIEGLSVTAIWAFVVCLLGVVDALLVDVAFVVGNVITGDVVMEVGVTAIVLRTEAHVCGSGVVAPASYSVVVIR